MAWEFAGPGAPSLLQLGHLRFALHLFLPWPLRRADYTVAVLWSQLAETKPPPPPLRNSTTGRGGTPGRPVRGHAACQHAETGRYFCPPPPSQTPTTGQGCNPGRPVSDRQPTSSNMLNFWLLPAPTSLEISGSFWPPPPLKFATGQGCTPGRAVRGHRPAVYWGGSGRRSRLGARPCVWFRVDHPAASHPVHQHALPCAEGGARGRWAIACVSFGALQGAFPPRQVLHCAKGSCWLSTAP